MSKKVDYYNQVMVTLQELHEAYPQYNMGRHLSTALDGYGDIWGLTDKELSYALYKYKNQLEMDVPHTEGAELDKIIKDGMDLDNILKEEDEDNGDY
jgi:hypothetical protein